MRRSLIVVPIALAAVLAACSSSTGPSWTYAPPTEAPASQPAASGASAAPSVVAPSADASAAPSGAAPSADASAAPSGSAGGDVVNLEAEGVAFVEKELSAPADKPFTIHFDNKDPGTPHNVEIKDATGQSPWKGDIVTGPIITDYAVPALAAGTYTFVCTVHANMTGTLTVGG
jgi:plastocyanin